MHWIIQHKSVIFSECVPKVCFVLNSAESILSDRSKRFTFYTLTYLYIPTPTRLPWKAFSLLQLLRKDYSLTFLHITIRVYSPICNLLALDGLLEYYTANQLSAYPTKTQVSLFHLRNRECGKQLNISWNGVNLTHCNLPVDLGITLARTLSYKAHIEKTKKKVGTRKLNHPKTKNLKMGSDSNHAHSGRPL